MNGVISIEEAYRKWAVELVQYATALCGPGDAADVVAETFAHQLERGDDRWRDVREPRAYLFRSVLNTARMRARSHQRRQRREERTVPAEAGPELLRDPAITRAVAGLSLQQRAIVHLTYWDDLPPSRIASMLAVSEGSVRRQLARARASLREVLS